MSQGYDTRGSVTLCCNGDGRDRRVPQVAERLHPGVYIRSFYFYDPDGIMLEFACWTKEFNADEANASPRTAADRHRRPIVGTH